MSFAESFPDTVTPAKLTTRNEIVGGTKFRRLEGKGI